MRLQELARYYYTARYLKPIQIIYRLRKMPSVGGRLCARRFSLRREAAPELTSTLVPLSKVLARRDTAGCCKVADQVLAGCFSFLNEEVNYEDAVNWNAPGRSHLWRFNLHYFDYAFALGVTYQHIGDRRYYDSFRSIAEDWITQNHVVVGDAWHPYATSLRIVNWVYCYMLFRDDLEKDPPFRNLFLKSLSCQASYLSRNLEFDLLGNHLIANAKALFVAGSFFDTESWTRRGLKLLKVQAEEQILADGGHFERSAMYHCIILGDYLDCLSWLAPVSVDYRFLKEKVEQMLEFLTAILLPGGRIPLFNDSAYGIAPDPQQIFSYANAVTGYKKPELRRAFAAWEGKDSGYYAMRNKASCMIIDGGKIGPDYQPGHGHCDLFSYELVLGNEKMIVDSGVYEYEEGEMRNYCRSTRAHNTVMVNNEEQSEIWKSFRVARRASPFNVQFVENDSSVFFHGRHDGYRRLGNHIIHSRWVALVDGTFWLVLDEIAGRGKHLAENFIHLHPEAQVSSTDIGTIEIVQNGRKLVITQFENAEMRQEQGWFCPEFGRRYSNTVLVLSTQTELPIRIGYLLIPGGVQQVEITAGDQDPQSLMFDIQLDEKRYKVDLSTNTVRKVWEDGD